MSIPPGSYSPPPDGSDVQQKEMAAVKPLIKTSTTEGYKQSIGMRNLRTEVRDGNDSTPSPHHFNNLQGWLQPGRASLAGC